MACLRNVLTFPWITLPANAFCMNSDGQSATFVTRQGFPAEVDLEGARIVVHVYHLSPG